MSRVFACIKRPVTTVALLGLIFLFCFLRPSQAVRENLRESTKEKPPKESPASEPAPQNNRTYAYSLRKGESLARLTRRFYGNPQSQGFIETLNAPALFPATEAQTIRVPLVMDYTVRRGDTLAAIANRYLGKAERFPFIMAESETLGYPQVEAGTHLKIPYSLNLVNTPADGVRHLTKKYYAEPYASELVLAYNNLPRQAALDVPLATLMQASPAPSPTSGVDLPVFDFVESAGDLKRSAESRRGPPLLVKAMQAYATGRYEIALPLLDRAERAPWNSFFEWALIHRYQAFCLIALGRHEEARRQLQAMKTLDPLVDLSGEEVSPKIRRLFHKLHSSAP